MVLTYHLLFLITQASMLPLLVSERVEKVVQRHLVITTQVRIMTGKLHCPAVFNSGLRRTLVSTE